MRELLRLIIKKTGVFTEDSETRSQPRIGKTSKSGKVRSWILRRIILQGFGRLSRDGWGGVPLGHQHNFSGREEW